MQRSIIVFSLFLALGLCYIASPVTNVDAQTKGKKTGRLPNYWRLLGLSADQIQQVYGLQEKYDMEIDKLEKQIAKLKDQQRVEMFNVLTEAQKTRLREILIKKGGGVPADPKDKTSVKDGK